MQQSTRERNGTGEGAAGPLAARMTAAAVDPDPATARHVRDALARVRRGSPALDAALDAGPDLDATLVGILSNSPFLEQLALGAPDRLARLLAEAPEDSVARCTAAAAEPFEDTAALMARLRALKQEVALVVALADLGGAWPLEAVTGALSDFADAAIRAALDHLLVMGAAKGRFRLADAADPATGSGVFVLAMGKHGARELNYSSDVDLIVLFDRRRSAAADPHDVDRQFVRLARDLVKILQERTEDGYVFRIDLRLRPDPGATPLAVAVDTAAHYYANRGLSWERAAFIKARAVAGDLAAARLFLRAIRPFVWRRRADFAAVEDVDAIREKMLTVKGHGEITVPGHDVKLGRGGIREIEFLVQTRQLIAGGRQPALRGRATLPMLAALAEAGWIETGAARELDAAYRYERMVEHRLQMIADEQTHRLPSDPEGLARVARLAGDPDPERFAEETRRVLAAVFGHYRELFSSVGEAPIDAAPVLAAARGDGPEQAAHAVLAAAGYGAPERVVGAVRRWLEGAYPATRTERARRMIAALLPDLLAEIAQLADVHTDEAFAAFDLFVSQLPGGVQFFSLLRNNPELLRLFALVLGVAPRLARVIPRRPRLLDVLIDPAFFGRRTAPADLDAALAAELDETDGYESVLDRLRVFGQEQRFLVSVRVLTGSLAARDAGEAFAAIADVTVAAALRAARAEFEKRHGRVPGGEVALVALGKLGGREMTASSDLDLILVYDHDPEATQSDGDRPLAPSQYFVRLTQRLVAALSAATAEGTLYEVDFRLRPSGNAGPLATSLASFERYQKESAWTWEHMALTRARILTGDDALSERLRAVIAEALRRPRERTVLAGEIADMRARIQREKGARDHFHLKTVPGGIVDVEFLAQYAQLAAAADHPEILATATADQIAEAGRVGFYDRATTETLQKALALYQPLSQVLRVALDQEFDAAKAQPGLVRLLQRAADAPDFAYLEATLKETEAAVARIVADTLG